MGATSESDVSLILAMRQYRNIVVVDCDNDIMLRTKSASCYAVESFIQSYTRTTERHVHMMMMMLRKERS